jgi:hypothetical protein
MGAILSDITIYYNGSQIKDAPEDWEFRRTLNFIADFYHNNLNGYKPIKTSRICIFFGTIKYLNKPGYFGSICSYYTIFDENKYLRLRKKEQYIYVLELLHTTIMEISIHLGWDNEIFESSYRQIIQNDFKFEKLYQEKISRDKKKIVQVKLTKTEDKSIITIINKSNNLSLNYILVEKKNWFWYDIIYSYAKNCKWLDNDSFGIKDGNDKCYYSFSQNKVINNKIDFEGI